MIICRIATNQYSVISHLSYNILSFPDVDEVHVIGHQVEDLSERFPGVHFHNVPIMRNISIFYDLFSLIKLIKLFISIKPDVVHSIMPKAGLLSSISSRIVKVPVRLHTFTGQVWSLLPRRSFKRNLLVFADIIISRLNTDCFVDSKSQALFLAKNGISPPGKECKFFGKGSLNGIDFTRLNVTLESEKFLTSKANFLERKDLMTCAYIARKSLDKGFVDFIRIASKLRSISNNYRFLFIGPDESNGLLEKILKENNFPCDWFVCVDYVTDFENYLLISDLLLLPSHREGFGSIVIEASFMGVPTVGYRIDGLIDSVSDGETGILVDENDIDAFVESVELLCHNKSLYNYLSANGKRRAVEHFSAEKIFNEYYTYLLYSTKDIG